MNRKYIVSEMKLNPNLNGLIIDDNKEWNHDSSFTRINKYISGDLHDFFDYVNDEELFKIIPDQFDFIFIGEIFHVINLQTIIYNLESAYERLDNNGIISICVNEDSEQTNKTSYRKMIDRLEKLAGFKLATKLTYVDEHAKEWTLLNLKKVEAKQVTDDTVDSAITIGCSIAELLNNGKNINKLKAGFLQSNSSLSTAAFKAAYTSNDEMLGLYLQNAIIGLEPVFNHQYLLKLADFIFENRKAIGNYSNQSNLQQGNFVIALENYQRTTIVHDQELIASYAEIFEKIWKHCLKQKINGQLLNQIDQLKE